MEVPDGKIVALLGANGAGKTTTSRAITGILDIHEGEITKGSVVFEGELLVGRKASEIVRAGISMVMEGRRIFGDLTIEENLRAGAYTNQKRASVNEQHDRVMILFPRIAEREKATAGYLSGGEQQMLAIGRALMADPRLMILDEPSLGLAPLLVQQVRDIIVEVNKAGVEPWLWTIRLPPTDGAGMSTPKKGQARASCSRVMGQDRRPPDGPDRSGEEAFMAQHEVGDPEGSIRIRKVSQGPCHPADRVANRVTGGLPGAMGGTGGVTSDHPAMRRRACLGAVCHPVDRVADTPMTGMRKVKGGTGDAGPTTLAALYVPIPDGLGFVRYRSDIVDLVRAAL